MRRLLPTARSFLIHSGQTGALLAIAVLAMAAAPEAMREAVVMEDEVVEAGAEPSAPPVRAEARPAGPQMRRMRFLRPINGYRVNSKFGSRHLVGEPSARAHQGVDIAAPTGTTVMAAADGVVTAAGFDEGGYGNYIEVRHPNGLRSFYGHLSRIDVRSGARVAGGERIGRVGSTGYSTGPHLHFEVRRRGTRLNPENYIGREFAVEATGAIARG